MGKRREISHYSKVCICLSDNQQHSHAANPFPMSYVINLETSNHSDDDYSLTKCKYTFLIVKANESKKQQILKIKEKVYVLSLLLPLFINCAFILIHHQIN